MEIKITQLNRETEILHYLKDSGFSTNFISNLRGSLGQLRVNGNDVTIRDKIKNGDILEIKYVEREDNKIVAVQGELEILYEDDYFLAVNKKPNIAVIPTRKHYLNSLANIVTYYMRNKRNDFVFRAINRLDIETSGIVLIALNPIAQHFLLKKGYDKNYLAILNGKLNDSNFDYYDQNYKKIQLPIYNDHEIKKVIVDNRGKDSITAFKVLHYDEKKNISIVTAKTITGRTHQLRVHFSNYGNYILGDCHYGEKSNIIDRTALHCSEITFIHPITKEIITVSAPFPKDMERIIK